MEESSAHLPRTIGFAELVERGRRGSAERLANILESVHAHDLATIMYTSGSTGEPKGVMRTQDNLLSNITNGGEIIVSRPDDLFVIVLSLNHLLGRFGFLKSAVTGRTTAIIKATEMDLDLKVVESLAGTAMAMVPRVMQRIWNDLLDQEGNRQRWEMIETLDRKNSADGLGAADREKFDVLVSELKKTRAQSARRPHQVYLIQRRGDAAADHALFRIDRHPADRRLRFHRVRRCDALRHRREPAGQFGQALSQRRSSHRRGH